MTLTSPRSQQTDNPVLYHVHGTGPHDFSSLRPHELDGVQNLAAAAGVDIVPTVFLRRSYLPTLRDVMAELAAGRGSTTASLGFAGASLLLPKTRSWREDVSVER